MLTDELKREIESHIHEPQHRAAACTEALRIVQRDRGWIDDDSIREIAAYLGMSTHELDSVATFFNLIHRRPVGRHVIRICASVIEWMMTNHPHDCPVCDEGGECHLQDMTLMTGHNYRRYRFEKNTYNNQDLGPLINHEMNRCIGCYRCVRYYKDYAGGNDLDVFSSHNHVYLGRHEDGTLESEFSGNLVEVCPTGVFTDKTLKKHFTRRWDYTTAPSVCVHCALGCNINPDGHPRGHGAARGHLRGERGHGRQQHRPRAAFHGSAPARRRNH